MSHFLWFCNLQKVNNMNMQTHWTRIFKEFHLRKVSLLSTIKLSCCDHKLGLACDEISVPDFWSQSFFTPAKYSATKFCTVHNVLLRSKMQKQVETRLTS